MNINDRYEDLWIAIINQIMNDITSLDKHNMPYERRLDIVKTMLTGGYDWLLIDGRKMLIKWFERHPEYYEWYKEDLIGWMNLLN